MVQVSEIEQIRGRRVRITFDDGTSYVILRSMLQERPLDIGDSVSPEEYADWVLKRQYRSALDKAVSALAVRACSKGEIEQKLRRIGYSRETIDMVLYKLESNELINDQDFAEQWARYRAGQKYGPRRIAQELRAKGVSTEEAEAALTDISEEDQLESAIHIAEKAVRRSGTGENPAKEKQRILAAVVRRGYGWDIARQAVDTVLKEE